MKLKNFFPPQISGPWCDQLNEGVNKLTRGKPFLGQNFFYENVCVYHWCYVVLLFYEIYCLFPDFKNFYMPLFGHFPIWAPTCFPEVICLRYGPGSLQELAAYIWDIYIFFKIITRNKALPCTLNFQIQKFLKVKHNADSF